MKERDAEHFQRDPAGYIKEKYGVDPLQRDRSGVPAHPLGSRLGIYADPTGPQEERSVRVCEAQLPELRRLIERHGRELERVTGRSGVAGATTLAEIVRGIPEPGSPLPLWSALPQHLPMELRRYEQAREWFLAFIAQARKVSRRRRGGARPPERALAEAACVADRWIRDARLKREPRFLSLTLGRGYQRRGDRRRAESDPTLACWPDVVRLLESFGFGFSYIGAGGAGAEQAIRKLVERHREREPHALCHARSPRR